MSNDNRVLEIRTFRREPKQKRRSFTFNTGQFLWQFFGTLEILVALRIWLDLIRANPDIPIVALIYDFTSLLLIPLPLVGWIGAPTAGGIVHELLTMFAMLMYALIIAWIVERIVWLIFYRPSGPGAGVTKTTTSILSHKYDGNDSGLS